MIIKYSNNKIEIEAVELSAFIANISNYVGVKITTTINCGTEFKSSFTTADMVDNTKNVYIQDSTLYILPQYFSGNEFANGVYKIIVEFTTATGYIIMQNCYFVDRNMACKVSSLLQNIVKENENSDIEPIGTMAHLLHYALFNGSNCGCNCSEMCEIFKVLQDLLDNVDTKLVNDCGC